MPPQQTNLTSATGRDAAGLGVDLAVSLAEDAPSNALAEASVDASIAARRDPAPEKKAAGPPVAVTRSVLNLLKGYRRAFRQRRQAKGLYDLNDRELSDIGLTRGDIDHLAAHRAIDRLRDGTEYLWLSRGL
jgi:uncharacterized protein YjiS (DUF1127 family)